MFDNVFVFAGRWADSWCSGLLGGILAMSLEQESLSLSEEHIYVAFLAFA